MPPWNSNVTKQTPEDYTYSKHLMEGVSNHVTGFFPRPDGNGHVELGQIQ